MNNKFLAEMIREKYYEEKMTAEYKLQLNKVVELEDNFLKDFFKSRKSIQEKRDYISRSPAISQYEQKHFL